MSEHLKTISEAIRKAIDEAPFYVVSHGAQYQILDSEKRSILVSRDPEMIEDACDTMNDRYVAVAAIEALKKLNIEFQTVYDLKVWGRYLDGIKNETA